MVKEVHPKRLKISNIWKLRSSRHGLRSRIDRCRERLTNVAEDWLLWSTQKGGAMKMLFQRNDERSEFFTVTNLELYLNFLFHEWRHEIISLAFFEPPILPRSTTTMIITIAIEWHERVSFLDTGKSVRDALGESGIAAISTAAISVVALIVGSISYYRFRKEKVSHARGFQNLL